MKGQSFIKRIGPYIYTLSALLMFVVFLFYPSLKTIYLSLYETNEMGRAKLLMGLGNYVGPFTSKSSFNSLATTSTLVVIMVTGSMILGLLSAMLCKRSFPGIWVFSTTYTLLVTIASSSAAVIFRIMLHPSVGIVNKLLGLDIGWVSDPRYTLVYVALLTAQLNSGINSPYFFVDLDNIDESICERASTDGTNEMQKFSRLTLPGLSPIMFYILVASIIRAFRAFGQVRALIKGGPGESTSLVVYSIYRDIFSDYGLGSVAAQSIIPSTVIMALTPMMFKVEKRGVSY